MLRKLENVLWLPYDFVYLVSLTFPQCLAYLCHLFCSISLETIVLVGLQLAHTRPKSLALPISSPGCYSLERVTGVRPLQLGGMGILL